MKKKIVTYEETTISKKLRKKCIEYLKNNPLEMYWDYQEKLSVEHAQQIIDGKLLDLENELWESNLNYTLEMEFELIKKMKEEFPELEDIENSDLREEFLDYLGMDLKIEDLLKHTTVRMRIVLHSNYEGFYDLDGEGMKNDYIKQIYKLLKNHVDKKSFEDEVLNSMMYTQFIFYGNVNLGDIYKYNFEKWEKITIQPDCMCGLFDSWNGSGSVLEVKLNKPITIKRQHGGTEYDNIKILIDEANTYSVEETYGLCNVPDLDFEIK